MKKEDLRISKTKASLYRGLLSLMKKKTFEDIKISEVCSESLVNRSTFYDHFNDKYELLESYINDLRNELTNSLIVDHQCSTYTEFSGELLQLLLDYIDKNKNIFSAVLKINSNSIARDMLIDAILNSTTNEINKRFTNKTNIPTKTIVLFYSSAFVAIIHDSLKDPNQFNKEQLFTVLTSLVCNLDEVFSLK